jgi:hypothetical protein
MLTASNRSREGRVMALQVDLPADLEQQLRDRAAASGQDVAVLVRALLEQGLVNGNGAPAPGAIEPRRETIHLGSPRIAEQRELPAEPPRGLLPVPPFVEEYVARQAERFPPTIMTEEAKKRTRDFNTLLYYYEGKHIACRYTELGVEVLAVGGEEIQQLKQRLTQEELRGVVFMVP